MLTLWVQCSEGILQTAQTGNTYSLKLKVMERISMVHSQFRQIILLIIQIILLSITLCPLISNFLTSKQGRYIDHFLLKLEACREIWQGCTLYLVSHYSQSENRKFFLDTLAPIISISRSYMICIIHVRLVWRSTINLFFLRVITSFLYLVFLFIQS